MNRIRRIIIITALWMPFIAASAQSIDEGRRDTRNEQYEDAEKVFNSLISANAKKGEPYYWAGINYLEQGDSLSAVQVFEKGTINAPKYTMNLVGKGQMLLRQGKMAEAEAMFQTALKTKKKLRPLVYREIGRSFLMIRDRSKATITEYAKKALDYLKNASQQDFEVLLLEGDALFITNPTDASEAITKYIQAGYINESDPQPLLREALLYQKVKNFDISLVRINEAMSKDEAFAPAYRQKAELYVEIKQRDSAVHYYREYLKRNNNLSARRRYVSALYFSGEFEETIKEAKELLKMKEFPNLYGVIAYAIVELNDTSVTRNQEGLDNFELYEEKLVKPANRTLSASEQFYKGILLYRVGQQSTGWSMMRASLADTAHSSSRWYDVAREEMYNNRDYAKSIEVLELKKAKKGEYQPTDLYYLAMSYRMNEQYAKSNEIFNQIVNKDSTYIRGFYYIALNWHLMDPSDSTGKVTEAYLNWMHRLTKEDSVKYRRDVENAYRAMADFYDRKGAKMYSNPEDKASGYSKTIDLYNKALENYRKVLEMAPDDETLSDWVVKLQDFVTKLEKRRGNRR